MRKTFIFIMALLLSGISILAEDKETEGILDARDKAIGKANKEAVKKLEKIMSAKTRKGDLDGALSIKNLIAKIKGETIEYIIRRGFRIILSWLCSNIELRTPMAV
jgi:hypothetical protein